jgi:hypothetical protein
MDFRDMTLNQQLIRAIYNNAADRPTVATETLAQIIYLIQTHAPECIPAQRDE